MKLELILLGLLKGGPKHGYELKKIIEEEIKPLTNVTLTSLYYTLDKLTKKGYLNCELKRKGHRPEKRVYALAPKGELFLNKLLVRNFLSLERPFFNLDLVLFFLDRIPSPSHVKKLIEKRISCLNEIIIWTEETKQRLLADKQPEHKVIIPEHLKKLIEVEIQFTQRLRELFLR
jgi:DNA-binding PadR family transcriptional regulator